MPDVEEAAVSVPANSNSNSITAGNDNEKEQSEEGRDEKPPPSLTKLLSLGKPEFRMLLLAILLMVIAESTGLLNPLFIAQAYDALVNPNNENRMSDINRVMIIVLVLHFGGVACAFVRSCIMMAAGERIVARLRNNLYSSLLSQDIAFFDGTKTGELVSRLSSDTALLQRAISQAVPEVMLGIIKLIVSMALMFWISAPLAGLTLGCTFIVLIICMPFGKVLGDLSKLYQDTLGQAQVYSTEALGGMRTVQSFSSEDRERERFASKIGRPADFKWWVPARQPRTTYLFGFWKGIVQSGFFTAIFGLGFGSLYISLWYGFKLVNDGELTIGQLTAFQSYIFQIGGSLAQTANFLSQVIEARGASGRIFDLLEREPTIPSVNGSDGTTPSQKVKPTSLVGGVEFKSVDFNYPSRPDVVVLNNFSLTIPSNTTAALVGSSGSGKSTVVALLQRFYDVTGGSITIDGHDVRDIDLKWLRHHIGYVQQEPQLFGMSVRENLCYGVDRVVSQDELEIACREANAHDFIVSWPMGYDTLVGERGVKLSGGQKQRIAIARALLVNPKILLLDEATSALDAESESLVQDAIEKAMVGRTVLIVAHRLSTIRRAEQIVVLDQHQIVDMGTHDVLMARCTKYQDLIKRQNQVHTEAPPVHDEMEFS